MLQEFLSLARKHCSTSHNKQSSKEMQREMPRSELIIPSKQLPCILRCPLSINTWNEQQQQQQKLTFEQRQISHESCGSFIAHLILFLVIDGVL